MPTTKSAAKRQRQSVESTLLNKAKKSRITSSKRDLESAIHANDAAKAQKAYNVFCSSLDKGAKAGVIKGNRADRSKSRAAKALKKIQA